MGRGPRRADSAGGADPGSRPSPYDDPIAASHHAEQNMAPVSGSALGEALSEQFGTAPGKAAIARQIGKRSLQALAASAGAYIAFGTPLAPVAGLAVGGYLAAKGVGTWRAKRRIEEARRRESAEALSPELAAEPSSPDLETNNVATSTDQPPSDLPESYPGRQGAENASGEETATVTQEEAAKQAAEEAAKQAAEAAAEREKHLQGLTDSVQNLIREEAVASLDKEIEEELRTEGMHLGKDFGEDVDPEAIEARKIMFAAGSVPVREDERDEVVSAVAALESAHLEKGPLKERLAAIKAQETQVTKDAAAAEKQQLADLREDIKAQAAQKKAELLAQKQEAQMLLGNFESNMGMLHTPESIADAEQKMDAIDRNIAAIDQALAALPAEEKQVLEQNSEAIRAHVAAQKEAILAGLSAEREALQSKEIGNIEGLVNLTTASGGEVVCRRCKTKPRTIRRRCSRCGAPFVIDNDHQRYIGKSDSDLQAMNKLDLLEKHEGDSEIRAQKWAEWRDGVRAGVPKPASKKATITKPKAAGDKAKETTSPDQQEGQAPSQQEAVFSGGGNIQDTLRKGLDGSEADYVAARNAARAANGSAIRLAGLKRFGPEEEGRMPTKKDQASCVVDGEFPMDFSAASNKGGLGSTQEGDRVMIRQSAGASYDEKNKMRLLGYADVRKIVRHSFTSEELSDPEAVRKRLGDIWDENDLGAIQDIFTRDRFIDYNAEDILYGNGSVDNPRPRPNFSLVLYENEQRFDQPIEQETAKPSESAMFSQGGGKTLREQGPGYQEIIDASYKQDHKVGTDEDGKLLVCGVRTRDGHPCANHVTRGQKYCWQHRGGPREGESEMSPQEISKYRVAPSEVPSGQVAEESINTAESNPEPASSARDIVSVTKARGERTFAPVSDPRAQEFIDSQNRDPEKSETLRTYGMTEYELAHYANSLLDGLHPGEGDQVILEPTHAEHAELADMTVDLAAARGIPLAVWNPNADAAEDARRVSEVQKNGRNMIFANLGSVQGTALPWTAGSYGDLIEPEGLRWSVTFVPTQAWADELADNSLSGFAECDNPLRQLAEDLQSFTYSDQEGGIAAHIGRLDNRARRMEEVRRERDVERIQIEGEGTSLSMELTEKTEWSSVDMQFHENDDRTTLANTATEEIWATPKAGSVHGTFQSSAPLALSAKTVIEGIKGEFKNGELVELRALKKNSNGEWVEDTSGQAALENFLGKTPDSPWPQCGELGLLDSSGRVANTGRRYLTPMIDEHGGLHIALGNSYAVNGGGADNGGSVHSQHLDITIGDKTTSVIGHTKDGDKISFIEAGLWQNF